MGFSRSLWRNSLIWKIRLVLKSTDWVLPFHAPHDQILIKKITPPFQMSREPQLNINSSQSLHSKRLTGHSFSSNFVRFNHFRQNWVWQTNEKKSILISFASHKVFDIWLWHFLSAPNYRIFQFLDAFVLLTTGNLDRDNSSQASSMMLWSGGCAVFSYDRRCMNWM